MDNPKPPDPPQNAREMIADAVRRIDHLQASELRRVDELRQASAVLISMTIDAERRRVNESIEAERQRVSGEMRLRTEHNMQLAVAEAKRIDAIRAVDVAAVAVANERATAQAAVLANQVSTSAETLRALVAATAATTAQQLAQLTTQLTDRLTSLEKSQYENKGSSGGIRDMYGWLLAGGMALMTIGSILWAVLSKK